MEEIDLFVKILVFVKILSQGQEFTSLEVQEASSLHLKIYRIKPIPIRGADYMPTTLGQFL